MTRLSDDLSKLISKGTAPIFTTETVFSDDPDAILVNIHAHSYWKSALQKVHNFLNNVLIDE